jgi:hypothetical protein
MASQIKRLKKPPLPAVARWMRCGQGVESDALTAAATAE